MSHAGEAWAWFSRRCRRSAVGLAATLAVTVVVSGSAPSAFAMDLHNPLFQITEVPVEGPHGEPVGLPGRLSEQSGSMAVGSGHVWLAGKCPGNCTGGLFRVDEFDAEGGSFLSQLAYSSGTPRYEGVTVGPSVGAMEPHVYLVENTIKTNEEVGEVGVYNESGVKPAQWTGATTPEKSFGIVVESVAVDDSKSLSDWAAGDVFVANGHLDHGNFHSVVDVFRPGAGGEEAYVTQLTGLSPTEAFQRVEGVTVDELTGDLIVTNDGKLDLFEPTSLEHYTFVRTLTTPSAVEYEASRVDANDGEGDIYAVASIKEGGVQQQGTQAIEFNAAGEFEGRVPVPLNSRGVQDVTSVAGDPEMHGVFVGVQESPAGIYAFGPNLVVPDVTTGAVSDLKSTSVTLSGTVDPVGSGSATCQFVWGKDKAYGETAVCPTVANGSGPVHVEASLSGLQPCTTYHYLLRAGNANGTNPGEGWQDEQFTTPGPCLRGGAAVDVSATAVTFQARIDPNGLPTSYYFQYGTSAEYGQQAPASSVGLGSGHGEVVSSVQAQGLQPGTVYHYRLVVTSEVAPGDVEVIPGPDRSFTTQPAGGSFSLPDGRQWELVSPANKLGALIEPPGYGVTQAAANGDAIAYRANGPTEPEPPGFARKVMVFSTRGAAGWSSHDIAERNVQASPFSDAVGNEIQIFSEDLSLAAMQPTDSVFTPLSPTASESTAYLRTDFTHGDVEHPCRSECYQPLVTGKPGFANVPAGTVFGEEPTGLCEKKTCGPRFEGGSPDLSHVVLSSPAELTATPAPAGGHGLYEWSGGALQLLDVLPEGEEGPAVLAGTGNNSKLGVRGSVSGNGQRVIMEGGGEAGGKGLYLRNVAAGETIRLDVPQGGSGPSVDARYMGASSDASRVFFLDDGRLTAESSPSGTDLYEYDLDAPAGSRLTDLSVDHNAGQAANVALMIGSSSDGSYVYFAAGGALAPGASEGECPYSGAVANKKLCNLYVRHEGVTRLVAAVPPRDSYDWFNELGGEFAHGMYARVSPDGRWFAFLSEAELTGYDTHDAVSGQQDVEVYLYDAVSGRLVCASCNPTGARPVGNPYSKEEEDDRPGGANALWVAAYVPHWTSPVRGSGSDVEHQPRYLSDLGRLFFESSDALVPQDVNGAEDVYEFEPVGVGDCSSASAAFAASSDGCVALVSAGSSPAESMFLDASETGEDVFFRTQSRLVSQDYDTAFDVYDAHVCSASAPCVASVSQPPPCNTEESCKAPPTPQPALYGAPASATFAGIGNAPASPRSAQPKRKPKQRTGHKRNTVKCRKRAGARRCAKRAASRTRKSASAVRSRRGGAR